MAETHVWQLLDAWRSRQPVKSSQASLARAIGVAPTALSQWKHGQAYPSPANLRKVHALTGIPWDELTAALLRDQGYVREAHQAAIDACMQVAPNGQDDLGKRRRVKHDQPPDEYVSPPADAAARDEGQPPAGERLRQEQDNEGERGE